MRGRSFVGVVSALGAALGALLLPATAAHAKCKFQRVAELPVRMEGLRPLIPVKLNGSDVQMVLDTGAFYSFISKSTADRVGARGVARPGIQLRGVGGTEFAGVSLVKEFTLAGAPIRNVEFIVGRTEFGAGSGGLLGQNVLSHFDVEYDLANGVIRLWKPDGCGDLGLAYWTNGSGYSDMRIDPITAGQPHITGKAQVNGRSLDVLFDTGAPTSMLTLKAAQSAGVRLDDPAVVAAGVTGGIGRNAVETWLAPVASFAIGQEEIRNTRLRVGRYDLELADMLIGSDFFLSHRILVSNSQRRLYFTYNGGPVFRLDRQPVVRTADGTPPPAAAVPAAAAPSDAQTYSLRGKASAARMDFKAAIADFDKAIELEPKDPQHYLDRAKARLAARQPVLALADLDDALKLKPDDPQTLLARGDVFLGSRDVKRAQADYEAAARLAPDDAGVAQRIASALMHTGHYDAAIARLDAWIGAHPQAEQVAGALNSRCYARALAGKQLDVALADCDAALKRGPRNSAVLDSRGLVRLRQGDLKGALADYDAALKLQPKEPWALYGRGLTRIRSGDKAGGEADVKAALALRPGLEEEAKRHHLTEGEVVVAASAS